MPRFRGYRRLTFYLNCALSALGSAPLVRTQMLSGHGMILDTRSQTESYALYSGEYEKEHVSLLSSLLESGSVFIDVGANIGFYTIALGATVSKLGGEVFSFEPLRSNFYRLQNNVRINGLESHVRLFNFGLSNETRSGRITKREDLMGGSETGNAAIEIDHPEERKFLREEVQLRPLDTMLGNEIVRVDIIKVDIEGHEDLFLEGAKKTIATHRPVIMIEVNKEYYRRRGGVDLYERARSALPDDYRIYVAGGRSRQTQSGGLGVLKQVDDFSGCGEIDTAFLIGPEKLQLVASAFAG